MPSVGTFMPYTKCGDVYTKCGDVYAKCGDVYTKCGDVYAKCGDVYAKCADVYAKRADVDAKCARRLQDTCCINCCRHKSPQLEAEKAKCAARFNFSCNCYSIRTP
jgi:hypothetical protein